MGLFITKGCPSPHRHFPSGLPGTRGYHVITCSSYIRKCQMTAHWPDKARRATLSGPYDVDSMQQSAINNLLERQLKMST